MIFHPRVGQCVRVHYAKRLAASMAYHGEEGVVCVIPAGPGPRDVGVEIDSVIVVVPRGNLMAESAPAAGTEAPEMMR